MLRNVSAVCGETLLDGILWLLRAYRAFLSSLTDKLNVHLTYPPCCVKVFFPLLNAIPPFVGFSSLGYCIRVPSPRLPATQKHSLAFHVEYKKVTKKFHAGVCFYKKVIFFPGEEFHLGCSVLDNVSKINEMNGIFFFFQALARSLKKQ